METVDAALAPAEYVEAFAAKLALARDFSADKRRQLAKEGKAMSDGSFPIEKPVDVKNAVKLAHTAEQRAHVKKRAKALGVSDMIPDTWH